MDETTVLEARLADMATALAHLEERVATLEQGQRRSVASALEVETPDVARVPEGAKRLLDVTLIGRSLIVLGGGYLLRAITDLHVVPDVAGVAAGLALAVVLIALADRAAARGASASSLFHATTALTIAYPLVIEMVGRFHLIGAEAGATLILGLGTALIVVARRRQSAGLA